MLPISRAGLAGAFLCVAVPALPAQNAPTPDTFDALRALIRPHPGESLWREVDWHTSLHAARVQAAAEGKPILLWSGGGAPPLGGC